MKNQTLRTSRGKQRKIRKMIQATVCGLLLTLFACESNLDDTPSNLPLFGSAPKIVQLTPRDGALVAQWTKVASAQGVAPNYEVYYSTSANIEGAIKFETIIPTASNLVLSTIKPLNNHQTYYVWVRSVFEGLGISDYSPLVYAVPVPPPETPGNITVTPNEGMLELRWEEVPDAVKYNIFYIEGLSAAAAPPEVARAMPVVLASMPLIRNGIGDPRATAPAVSAPGTVIPHLRNGTTYTVWVQAENTAGISGYSRNSGSPQIGAAPVNVPVIKSITPGNKKLTLVWDQVPGVPRYKLFYSTSNNSGVATQFPSLIPADSPRVSAELTGLTNGTTYYVWVKSSNSAGDSASFSEMKSGAPAARGSINWQDAQFELGQTTAEYPFAQDVPPSRFFPDGRPNTDRLTRVQETSLGNLFTDAAAWYVREMLGEQLDFVFLNGSYIDNVLAQGTITLGALTGVVGPDARVDKIVLLSVTGAQLKEFFGVTASDTPVAYSVAAVPHMGRGGHDTGYFGMVSQEIGYTIEYPKAPSGTKPELSSDEADAYWHGRIKAGTLKFKGTDIVDTQVYRICTTDFNASGVYYLLLANEGTDKKLINTPFYRAVAEYIYDKQTITPKLDGRIKIEGGVPLPPPWVNSDWNPYGN